MPKQAEKGTLWHFSTSILSQNSKKIGAGTLWGTISEKKSRSAKKIERGTLWSRPIVRYGMLRGKTGKTFLVQFARANGAIWCNTIL